MSVGKGEGDWLVMNIGSDLYIFDFVIVIDSILGYVIGYLFLSLYM